MQQDKNPVISIIVPIFNAGDFLEGCLQSIFAQNYPNLELIVMDGGSTDTTHSIVEKYADRISKFVSARDQGNTDACNKAIDLATGDLIGFINADDRYEGGALLCVASCFKQTQAEIVSGGMKIIDDNGKILKVIDQTDDIKLDLKNMLFGLPLLNSRFYKKSIFNKYGKFKVQFDDGRYFISGDREFMLRLAMNHQHTEIVNQVLHRFLVRADSLSSSRDNFVRIYQEHITVAKEYLRAGDLNEKQINLFKKWIVLQYIYLLKCSMHKFSVKESWDNLRGACQFSLIEMLMMIGMLCKEIILDKFKRYSYVKQI